jgi:UPF0755 protein
MPRARAWSLRRTIRETWWWLVSLVTLAVALASFTLAYRVRAPYQGYQGQEQIVRIAPGRDARAIARRLARAGVVRDGWSFRLGRLLYAPTQPLKPGEYLFRGPKTIRQVLAALAEGGAPTRLVRVPPGMTLRQMATFYERNSLGRADEFLAAAADEGPIRDIDAIAWDLEGYLYPDVYALPPDRMPARELVEEMVERFRDVFEGQWQGQMVALAQRPRDVVTLASIIERETARDSERALVSAVYNNRLRIGMILQADPTVIYALSSAGLSGRRLSRADLRFDSPYNTYRYRGLPPGPIASPGLATLYAAMNPADVDYLFFVSRNDGTHAFSRTLQEHNANVFRFQILPRSRGTAETLGRGGTEARRGS